MQPDIYSSISKGAGEIPIHDINRRLYQTPVKLMPKAKRKPRKRKEAKTAFTLTGNLVLQREVIETALSDAGYKIVEYVNLQTDYVIVGDNPGRKWKRAKPFMTAYTEK